MILSNDAVVGPCTNNNGGCRQICITLSSKTKVCDCAAGFFLNSNGETCSPRKSHSNTVYPTSALTSPANIGGLGHMPSQLPTTKFVSSLRSHWKSITADSIRFLSKRGFLSLESTDVVFGWVSPRPRCRSLRHSLRSPVLLETWIRSPRFPSSSGVLIMGGFKTYNN